MSSLRMPAEHGAWGILVVPFFCAAAVAGVWNLPLLLVGVCALALFLLRASLEGQLRGGMRMAPAQLALLVAAVGAGAGVVVFYQRLELVGLGLAAALVYTAQNWLQQPGSRRQELRSLLAQLLGTVALTMTAPAAWIAARGRLDAAGALVWLLNLLFFAGGVLYVKYRVRGVRAHCRFAAWRERLRFAWPVVAYHAFLLVLLAAAASREMLPLAVLAAFVPGVGRGLALLLQLGRRFPIRRLGWSEVAHSLVFALLLVLALRAS